MLSAFAGLVSYYIIVATKIVGGKGIPRNSSGFFGSCGYNDGMAGKPRDDRSTVKGNTLRIRLTGEQRSRLDKFAKSMGKETSTWAREELLAWRKKLRDGS